jgi:carotenoid cleavage dioxygenase-like enzyme
VLNFLKISMGQRQMAIATNPQSNKKAWAGAILSAAKEFDFAPLPVLSGKIPEGLRGTLYRNGPGRLERGGRRVGHWFDGDGAILAVNFTDAGATGIYRFVQTKGYCAEAIADRFLYANYGMTYPGPVWNYWISVLSKNIPVKNAANTSVMALPDRLWALWEGGNPYVLDLETLETIGTNDLGVLGAGLPYTAHPLRDPKTGDIYNIGMEATFTIDLFRSDRSGKVIQKGELKLDSFPILHSFAMAGQYLIFLVPPMQLRVLPLLLGVTCYADAFEWQPQKGTKIIVVDRDTMEVVSRVETDPWFQWHFGNACVETDGMVRLDFVRFRNFAETNEYLREVPTGETHTRSHGTLWQMRLNPRTGKVIDMQQAVGRCCEFPVVPQEEVGQPWRYTYFGMLRRGEEIGKEWFGAIARFDYQTGTLTEADLGENRYPVEPIYAPDRIDPKRGWVLTVVYDGNTDKSEVWVFESDRLDAEPVCRLSLPQVMPLSFHGTWRKR